MSTVNGLIPESKPTPAMERVKNLEDRMRAEGSIQVNKNDERYATLKVPEETLLEAYKSAGFSKEQVDTFLKTTSEASRALYYAALHTKIDLVKAAVAAGKDYQGFVVTASCKYRSSFDSGLSLSAKTKAKRFQKRDFSKVDFRTNGGSATMITNDPLESRQEQDAATE